MIFTRYLISAMLRNQLIVLLVLFLVFFSQKFIRILNLVVDGNIPKSLIFIFFGLGVPEVMKLVLPVSLFIGILMTFNGLHLNNEIIGLYSCGVGVGFIFRRVLFLSSITMIFSMFNVWFLSPFCIRYQNELMLQYQSNFNTVKFLARQFQFIKSIHSVCFIDSFCGTQFKNIFFTQMVPNNYCSVVVADRGYIEKFHDGSQWVILEFGYYYLWNNNISLQSSCYMNRFNQHKILINQNLSTIKSGFSNTLVTAMSVNQLWSNSTLLGRVEFHWRLTLVVVVFIMTLIIFPLSLMKLSNSHLLNVFPVIVLYLVFFLLQIFLRSYASKGYVDLIWIWIVNCFYILIAIILNFWGSVICRNFLWKLKLFCMGI